MSLQFMLALCCVKMARSRCYARVGLQACNEHASLPSKWWDKVQVRFVGYKFSFGDIKVLCGQAVRRTNDTLTLGTFMCVCYEACSLIDQAEPILADFWAILQESVLATFEGEPLKLSSIEPPVLTLLGRAFTAKHAAALFVAAASHVQQ